MNELERERERFTMKEKETKANNMTQLTSKECIKECERPFCLFINSCFIFAYKLCCL